MSLIKFNPANGMFLSRGQGLDLLNQGWDYFSDGTLGASLIYGTSDRYKVVQHYEACDELAQQQIFLERADFERSYASAPFGAGPPVRDGLELFPYQKAGVEYALARDNTIIGDEPGLGKTAQAIAHANAIGAGKVLVVCPASLRLNWLKEIQMWSTIERPAIYPVIKGEDGVNPFSNFVIISYDLCRNDSIRRALKELRFDSLVLDEAHYLKTPDAGRTRAIFGSYSEPEQGIAAACGSILALTGTPLPNRPKECYTLVRNLNWGAFDELSEAAFYSKYNPSMRTSSGWTDERTGHLAEMRARLRCNLMVRRKKSEVLKDLPDKRYELIYVEEDAAIRRVVEQEKLIDFDPSTDMENQNAEAWGHISTVRMLMSVAMAPRVAKHCAILLDGGLDKLGIGYFHRETGNILEEALKKYGTVRVDGRVPVTRRQRAVEKFQTDPGTRVFLGQTGAAGVGHTLTAASHTVVMDPSWTPGENEQWVDRFHRIGQRNSVLAQFPVAQDSWNEKILSRAIEKLKTTTEALDG